MKTVNCIDKNSLFREIFQNEERLTDLSVEVININMAHGRALFVQSHALSIPKAEQARYKAML